MVHFSIAVQEKSKIRVCTYVLCISVCMYVVKCNRISKLIRLLYVCIYMYICICMCKYVCT